MEVVSQSSFDGSSAIFCRHSRQCGPSGVPCVSRRRRRLCPSSLPGSIALMKPVLYSSGLQRQIHLLCERIRRTKAIDATLSVQTNECSMFVSVPRAVQQFNQPRRSGLWATPYSFVINSPLFAFSDRAISWGYANKPAGGILPRRGTTPRLPTQHGHMEQDTDDGMLYHLSAAYVGYERENCV